MGYDNEGYYGTDPQWDPNTAWGEESSNQPQPAQVTKKKKEIMNI